MKVTRIESGFGWGLTVCCLLCALAATAAPVIYEPFGYDVGPLKDKSGAIGLGSWLGGTDMPVVSGTLWYGNLDTAGNRVSLGDEWASNYASCGTTLSSAGLMTNGATLWFSIVWKFGVETGNAKSAFALGNNTLLGNGELTMSGSGSGVGIFSDSRDHFYAATWSNGVASKGGSVSMPAYATQLIVGRIVWGADAGSADTLNLYLPNSALEKGAVVSTMAAVLDQSGFNRISLACKKYSGTKEYADEIRFGATYDDVVYEPPASGLMLYGQ